MDKLLVASISVVHEDSPLPMLIMSTGEII
nr:MAG TPA_asm: hypothetical protein [Caudoviricetes sp.]